MKKSESNRPGVRRWALPAAATAVVLGIAVTASVTTPDGGSHEGADPSATLGTVVDETGKPVPDARIRVGGEVVSSDDDGTFALTLSAPSLVSAQASGHLPRTQAVAPGGHPRIVLTSGAENTMSLRFGGDVMFGDGYYEETDEGTAFLGAHATAADHADVLGSVAPLMQDSDLTVVNLETPLIDEPYYDPDEPRPERFHPTKKSAFASATEAADALRMSGVDVVSMANDHAFDALDAGIDSTVSALDAAGVAYFGAGRSEDEAWQPAIVEHTRGSVAFLGCTTVDGERNPIPYVADDDRGGAAECSTDKIEEAVSDAEDEADTVVVMLHGGNEYERRQSPAVQRYSDAAAEAGASIVVGGHPHVSGGIRTVGSTVVAESTGTLADDRPLWSAGPSQLLRVDLRAGKPVYTSVDPLMMMRSRPVPVTGSLADSASRIAAGSVEGAVRLGGAGAEIAALPRVQTPAVGAVSVEMQPGVPRRLAPGWFVGEPQEGIRVGTDLLWGAGRFDDQDTAPGDQDSHEGAALWDLGHAARTTSSAACVDPRDRDTDDDGIPDGRGLELVRSPKSTKDVYARSDRRVGVIEGQQLSLLADVRSASPGSEVEIRWYSGFSGKSVGTTSVSVPETEADRAECTQVRIDATVPPGVVAAQPYVRLSPPGNSLTGPRLAVDDVRLVAWSPDGAAGRRFDTVERTRPGVVRVSTDKMEGDGALVGNGNVSR